MSRERQEARVVDRFAFVEVTDDHFHIVVQTTCCYAPQVLEGPHVLPHRGLEILALDKTQVLASRITEDVAEQMHASPALGSEVDRVTRVVHLSLSTRASLETDDRLTCW